MSHIIKPFQRDLLKAFFTLPASDQFVLTGGTALAEYYLRHRLSEDLDLFTLDNQAFAQISQAIRSLGAPPDISCDDRRLSPHLHQAFLARGEERVKMDIVLDVGPWFGTPQVFDDIRVDALENIAANKLVALFGRATERDFVDLYFILRETELSLDNLLNMAKQKDTGLHEFYLAGWVHQEAPKLKMLPTMIKPLDIETLREFGQELARELVLRAKPPE